MSYEDKRMSKHNDQEHAGSPKYCKDCKWCSGPYGAVDRVVDRIIYRERKDPYRHSLCLHPDMQFRGDDDDIDTLLSGFKEPERPYFCATNRIRTCGPAGTHWEAKEL